MAGRKTYGRCRPGVSSSIEAIQTGETSRERTEGRRDEETHGEEWGEISDGEQNVTWNVRLVRTVLAATRSVDSPSTKRP